MLRVGVSAKDTGVPNWLDTAGNPSCANQGRWTDCNSQPVPSVRKVAVAEVRASLPAETPSISPEERQRIIRDRRPAYQQSPLWRYILPHRPQVCAIIRPLSNSFAPVIALHKISSA